MVEHDLRTRVGSWRVVFRASGFRRRFAGLFRLSLVDGSMWVLLLAVSPGLGSKCRFRMQSGRLGAEACGQHRQSHIGPYAQIATMRSSLHADGANAGVTRHATRLVDVGLDIVSGVKCTDGPISGDHLEQRSSVHHFCNLGAHRRADKPIGAYVN
ncbi:MAG: hypothetical protein ACREP2_11705 [Rhodanobacteraceae bacterium]